MYVVWRRDKRVGIGLALLFGLYQIHNAIVLDSFIRAADCKYCVYFVSLPASVDPLKYVQNPLPEVYRGCAVIKANRNLYANWIIFTIGEGGTLNAT